MRLFLYQSTNALHLGTCKLVALRNYYALVSPHHCHRATQCHQPCSRFREVAGKPGSSHAPCRHSKQLVVALHDVRGGVLHLDWLVADVAATATVLRHTVALNQHIRRCAKDLDPAAVDPVSAYGDAGPKRAVVYPAVVARADTRWPIARANLIAGLHCQACRVWLMVINDLDSPVWLVAPVVRVASPRNQWRAVQNILCDH